MKPLKEILPRVSTILAGNSVAGVIALCILAVTVLALSGREISQQGWVILGGTISLLSISLLLKYMRSRESLEVHNYKVQVRNHIRETLRVVEEKADLLKTRPPETPLDRCRMFAAGGLMRCCELLNGIRILEDASLHVPAGILHRQHWETWLVSLYVLLRGEEALSEICGDYVVNTRRLSKSLGLEAEHVSDWKEGAKRLNYYQLAEALGPLLIQAGETCEATAAVMGYSATYRVQSQFSVHAGLSTIRPYIRIGDESSSVETNPPAPLDGNGQFAALYTLHLARYVFERFGIPTDAVEKAMDELNHLAKSEGAASRPE